MGFMRECVVVGFFASTYMYFKVKFFPTKTVFAKTLIAILSRSVIPFLHLVKSTSLRMNISQIFVNHVLCPDVTSLKLVPGRNNNLIFLKSHGMPLIRNV